MKNPPFHEFARFDNAWTHLNEALKDPICRTLVRAVGRCLYEKLQ